MMKKRMAASLILLIFSLACLPVATYAWFTFVFAASSADFSTGKLQPQTEIYLWNNDLSAWTEVPETQDGSHLIYPNLGEINSLFELPSDFGIYLKIRINEAGPAAYKWKVVVNDIKINALDSSENAITATPQNHIGLLNYYGELNQKCFYYKTALGTDNLHPNELMTYDNIINLAEQGQPLSDDYLASDSFLYVHITAGAEEVQNIIRCIPIDKMPYVIHFQMTFTGQARTLE